MYEDNPRRHVENLLEKILFPNSTLGWNIAGPREVIRSVSRGDLTGYRDAYYIPSRMTVVVAGKIIPGIMPLLQKTFGSVRRRAGADEPFDPFCPPARLHEPFAYQEKETEQAQLMFGFHGLKIGDPRLPATALLATILGGTMSSRLFIEIRERRGLCYSVYATHEAREDIGGFYVGAGLDKKRFREAVRAIVAELKKVATSGVTDEELRRAKDHIRGKTTLAFEDSATQAEWYGKQWMFQGMVETPAERMKRFDKVTRRDVHAIARAIFRPERMAAAVIGPFGSKDKAAKLIMWG